MTSDATPNSVLRAKGKPRRNMTANQIGCVLNDVAESAKQIDTLIARLQGVAGDVHMVDFLAGAVAALAQRIGWAVDMAAERIPGVGGAAFGGAEHWMMPRSYHLDDEGRDVVGGASHG